MNERTGEGSEQHSSHASNGTQRLPCASCGYNLEGIESRDRCPECDFSIASSLEALSERGFLSPFKKLLATVLVGCLLIVCVYRVLSAVMFEIIFHAPQYLWHIDMTLLKNLHYVAVAISMLCVVIMDGTWTHSYKLLFANHRFKPLRHHRTYLWWLLAGGVAGFIGGEVGVPELVKSTWNPQSYLSFEKQSLVAAARSIELVHSMVQGIVMYVLVRASSDLASAIDARRSAAILRIGAWFLLIIWMGITIFFRIAVQVVDITALMRLSWISSALVVLVHMSILIPSTLLLIRVLQYPIRPSVSSSLPRTI